VHQSNLVLLSDVAASKKYINFDPVVASGKQIHLIPDAPKIFKFTTQTFEPHTAEQKNWTEGFLEIGKCYLSLEANFYETNLTEARTRDHGDV